MKTIVEPREYIDKLWGKQRINETEKYRLIHYVFRVDHEGKVVLHNVVTGHMVELEQDEAEAIDKLPMAYQPVMEQLVSRHFLVPERYDEYKTVKQLRTIYQTRQTCGTGNYINQYVILPTTFCNARCFYCYESDYPHVQMTEETANALLDYIEEHREGKKVGISWFGGEPLVGIQRIDQISQGLKDRNIPYESSMISNGYLFDESIIKKAVDLWKLTRIQITLDGTEEIYNRVKAYVNIKDNPFQRVLRNIDLLTENKIRVNIRLNLDFYNKDDIRILIEELGERYSGNKYITVYPNMLFNDQGFEPVHHSFDDMIQLSQIVTDYSEKLREMHLSFDNLKELHLQFSQCMADNPHSVMIQPDGGFCRCEHENIHDRYGSLKDGVTDPKKLIKWREATEHSEKCPECPLYPACYSLAHCHNADMPCIDSIRINNLDKHRERVRSLYIRKMEVGKNEDI